MDGSRRRVLLGTLAAVGFSGCLEDDSGPSDADSDEPAPGSTDQTPTDTSATNEVTPSETPDGDQQSPERTDSTPVEHDDEPSPTPVDEEVFPGYEMTDVAVQTPDGDELGWVRAAIANTPELRYTGLSDTDPLPESYGMLFVFDDVDERAFVMREMDFGIDILYAADDGVITAIHHAPEPGPDEDGSEQRYEGRGQYVLEVNKGWTTDRDVEEGDVLDFDLPD